MFLRISICVLALLPALLCSCQRDGPAVEERAARVRGTHPWDQPDWKAPVEPLRQGSTEASEDSVQAPAERGPVLPTTDTLLEPAILGRYVQICQVAEEKMNLVPIEEQDILELAPNGYATWTGMKNFKPELKDGSWKKSRPGALELTFGGSIEMFGQLYEQDFLYLWSYERRTGFWFVRIPQRANPRIAANRFNTSRGDLNITRYVGASWQGEVSGETPMTVSGFYNAGVLTMRWETQRSGGYAAFIASEDWSSLRGVYWQDDWEAVPFGGDWTATRAE